MPLTIRLPRADGTQSDYTLREIGPLLSLTELFILADKAGLLCEPELAVARMRQILEVSGF